MGIIYSIKCKKNRKVYVGKCDSKERVKDPDTLVKRRMLTHHWKMREGYKNPLYEDMRKFGLWEFDVKVLEVIKDDSLILEREQHWIHKLEAHTNGYNFTDSGKVVSEYTKRKISESLKGNPLLATRPMLGRTHSPESIEKMRKVKLGKVVTEEQKAKTSAALKGKNINKGGKQIQCIETGVVFPTASEAARQMKLNVGHVARVAKGLETKTGGFTFRYLKETEL